MRRGEKSCASDVPSSSRLYSLQLHYSVYRIMWQTAYWNTSFIILRCIYQGIWKWANISLQPFLDCVTFCSMHCTTLWRPLLYSIIWIWQASVGSVLERISRPWQKMTKKSDRFRCNCKWNLYVYLHLWISSSIISGPRHAKILLRITMFYLRNTTFVRCRWCYTR